MKVAVKKIIYGAKFCTKVPLLLTKKTGSKFFFRSNGCWPCNALVYVYDGSLFYIFSGLNEAPRNVKIGNVFKNGNSCLKVRVVQMAFPGCAKKLDFQDITQKGIVLIYACTKFRDFLGIRDFDIFIPLRIFVFMGFSIFSYFFKIFK